MGYWPETLTQGAGKLVVGKSQRVRQWVRYGMSPGAPDIHVIGQNVYLEVKRPGGKRSKEQKIWAERAKRFGAIVAVVHSPEEAQSVMEGVVALRKLLWVLERLFAPAPLVLTDAATRLLQTLEEAPPPPPEALLKFLRRH